MKPSVYIETSMVSYLTSLPSRDLVTAAHQQITRDWWERRGNFDLFISQAVLREASLGNQEFAARRLAALKEATVLPITDEATTLSRAILSRCGLPETAQVDSLHIALAVVHGMDFLLTWNCTHIANAAIRHRIERVCNAGGFEVPIICTPEELMEV